MPDHVSRPETLGLSPGSGSFLLILREDLWILFLELLLDPQIVGRKSHVSSRTSQVTT